MAMNPGLSAAGMAVNILFERPPGGTILTAHQDDAGNWQIGDGLHILADGTVVGPKTVMTDYQYGIETSDKWRQVEAEVQRLVTVDLNQYQWDALYLLANNCGSDDLAESELLTHVNARRWNDAAARFGDFVYAKVRNKFDSAGNVIGEKQFGPDGQLLTQGMVWQRAWRGLYRRRCLEACLFLSLDGNAAIDDQINRIDLETDPEWQPAKNRWRDTVTYKTPWADVLRVAIHTKLPPPAVAKALPKQITIEMPDNWETMAQEDRDTFWLNTGIAKGLGAKVPQIPATAPKPIVPAPAKAPAAAVVKKAPAVVIDGSKDPKFIEHSKRGKDANRAARGKETTVLGAIGTLGTGGTAIAVSNVEKVGKVIETLKPQTFLYMGATFCLFLIVVGVLMWWNGRASLHYRRQHEQEPLG
jgi:GH24 family phage-related lysozyme (muramidase)